jgi:hypothetical protein
LFLVLIATNESNIGKNVSIGGKVEHEEPLEEEVFEEEPLEEEPLEEEPLEEPVVW